MILEQRRQADHESESLALRRLAQGHCGPRHGWLAAQTSSCGRKVCGLSCRELSAPHHGADADLTRPPSASHVAGKGGALCHSHGRLKVTSLHGHLIPSLAM